MLQKIGQFLPQSVGRANIGRQLEASNMIGKTDEFLERILDKQSHCAKALSYKSGQLTIECTSSAVANIISSQENELRSWLRRFFPQAKLKNIHTRLTLNFDL